MRRIRVRLQYLIRRARRIRPGNLVEFARTVQRVSKAPLPVIIADMLWCSLRYDMAFRDYAVWDIRLLNARERKTWMTHPKSFRITKMYNTPEGRSKLEDKRRFAREYADLLGRETIDLRDVDDTQLAAFLARHPRVLAKPNEGHGGGGIDLHEVAPDVDAARSAPRSRRRGRPSSTSSSSSIPRCLRCTPRPSTPSASSPSSTRKTASTCSLRSSASATAT